MVGTVCSDFPKAFDKLLSRKILKKQNSSKMKGKFPAGNDVRSRNKQSGISVGDNKWNPTGICTEFCDVWHILKWPGKYPK